MACTKLKYFLSNYESRGAAQLNANKASATAANYFDQRARIFYSAKANDDLKLVTGFEIDSVFGDRAQSVGARGFGGALESDSVNLETKWVYLDFNIPSTPVKVKAGIQPYKDVFKGIFLDADIAGLYATANYGKATTGIAYFRAYESTSNTGVVVAPRGTDNLDIALLEGKYRVSNDLSVGGGYYLLSDYRTNQPQTFHTFGVNAEAKLGPATVSGFAAYQAGFSKQNTSGLTASKGTTINAWSVNLASKIQAGPGTAKAAFLYTSGDQDKNDGVDHSWQSVSQTQQGVALPQSAANSYTESGMMLLNRNPATGGTTSDTNIIYTTNNNAQGAAIITAGYDATITPKIFATANIGAGLTAENNQNSKGNGSHYLGTEINAEVGYKLYDNLTASLQGAYLVLGPYYKDTVTVGTGKVDPVNPYTARINLTYTF